MAQVTLTIGGRVHAIPCRDGDEAHIRDLGAVIEERAGGAARAAGNAGPERMMLLIALMLADDLAEAQRVAAVVTPPPEPAPAAATVESLRREIEAETERGLALLADRLEAVAAALEADGASS